MKRTLAGWCIFVIKRPCFPIRAHCLRREASGPRLRPSRSGAEERPEEMEFVHADFAAAAARALLAVEDRAERSA